MVASARFSDVNRKPHFSARSLARQGFYYGEKRLRRECSQRSHEKCIRSGTAAKPPRPITKLQLAGFASRWGPTRGGPKVLPYPGLPPRHYGRKFHNAYVGSSPKEKYENSQVDGFSAHCSRTVDHCLVAVDTTSSQLGNGPCCNEVMVYAKTRQ